MLSVSIADMKTFFVVLAIAVVAERQQTAAAATTPRPLFLFPENANETEGILDCLDEGLEFCMRIDIDFDAFASNDDLLIEGVVLKLKFNEEGSGGAIDKSYEACYTTKEKSV